jgi:hypothetical protein
VKTLEDAMNNAVSAEEQALRTQAEVDRLAYDISTHLHESLKTALGRAAAAKDGAVSVTYDELLNDVDAIGAATTEAMKKALTSFSEPTERHYHIGELVPGKGIYFGIWSPLDEKGNPILGQKYYAFAAPQDLQDDKGNRAQLNYDDAAQEVAKLRNWHGHNGAYYETDKSIVKALEGGYYNGEWFIPPVQLLCGKKATGKLNDDPIICETNLFAVQERGALKGTFFKEKHEKEYSSQKYYWTSTCVGDFSDESNWVVNMQSKTAHVLIEDREAELNRYSIRPCRLEPVPQPLVPQ